jgi:hypothetical protein
MAGWWGKISIGSCFRCLVFGSFPDQVAHKRDPRSEQEQEYQKNDDEEKDDEQE